jgi:hypothetical protein
MMSAAVILVPGETYSFYIPFDSEVTLANTTIDLVIDGSKSLAWAGIGTLTAINVQAGVKHYSAQINMVANTSNLLPVYYRFRLNVSGGSLYSNRVLLKKANYADTTALVSYRNTRPIGPIAYDLPALANFRNVLRVKCQIEASKTDASVEDYERITTGVKTTVEIKGHLFYSVKTPTIDPIGHEGWRTLLFHKDLLINNRPFALKTGYAEGEGTAKLATGSFEVWDLAYSAVNRC